MLNVKSPSQLYKEAHAGNYAMMRSKGDEVVNHMLDSRLERESGWAKKFSTTSHMHTLWQENIENGQLQETHKDEPYEVKKRKVQVAKKAMQKSIKQETLECWNEKVRKLTFQGSFMDLLIEEKENVTWQSIASNVPKGVLSFALKATVNGLNTPDNLVRWGKRKLNRCDLCGNRSDLMHVLNWCPVALKEGRFTWRHNSVLNYMLQEMLKVNLSETTINADLDGFTINGSTIPADILSTGARPDLVLLNRKEKKIEFLELTCKL